MSNAELSQTRGRSPRSRLLIYFQLGRVSNLPTVWTNCLAGAALASGSLPPGLMAGLAAALSLFYIGGMFLNDAFDADHDRIHRPERPIPAGRISRPEVLAVGGGLLAAGQILMGLLLAGTGRPLFLPLLLGLILALCIVYYDYSHKNNWLAPPVMASCRALIYLICAAVFPANWETVLTGAALLALYVLGLTYVARAEAALTRQAAAGRRGSLVGRWPYLMLLAPLIYLLPALREGIWVVIFFLLWTVWTLYALACLWRKPPRIGTAVVRLIAGISLLDAVFIVLFAGSPAAGLIAVLGFRLTLLAQRWVAGT